MSGLTIIKKYANRRLYDTSKSSYVTLNDLAVTLQEGHDIKIIDAKSGQDLTKSVLMQIVIEKESTENGMPLLTTDFLKSLIKIYGHKIEAFAPVYLEQAIGKFLESQEKLHRIMEQSFDDVIPSSTPDQRQQRNRAIAQKTMEMFTPFNGIFDPVAKEDDGDNSPPSESSL